MPVLDTFTLRCEVNLFLGEWEVSYYAAGVKTDWNADGGKDASEVRRLYWAVEDVWRPSGFVAETLRSFGQDKHGSELIETFTEGMDLTGGDFCHFWSWF
jgi:hypothetical protein